MLLEKAASAPRHNYGITLHPWAYRPLLEVLQIDEMTFRQRLAVDSSYGNGIGRLPPRSDIVSSDVSSDSFRAHLAKLEALLREGIDVRWSHALTKAQNSTRGMVMSFEKGQRVESKTTVGADGVHSQLRKSFFPESHFDILPYVVFNGKYEVEKQHFQEVYEPYLKNANWIETRKDDVLLQISVNDYVGNTVSISYTYSRPARPADPLHKPDRSAAGAAQIPEAFYAELLKLEPLNQPFKQTFDSQRIRKDRLLHWLMRSVLISRDELQNAAELGVVMVGDAAHAMPILGSQGANTAIQDGIELAEYIALYGSGNRAIMSFYKERYGRWESVVSESRKLLLQMHEGQKSVL